MPVLFLWLAVYLIVIVVRAREEKMGSLDHWLAQMADLQRMVTVQSGR